MDTKYSPISYYNIIEDIKQFKRSGGSSGSEFNRFETPSQLYFKLIFYFNNPATGESEMTSNLLGCDWLLGSLKEASYSSDSYQFSNSAYNYLMMNDEKERAEKLKKFIYLLSDINSQSPWYFQSITGLDAALERKQFTDRDFKVDEERKQISIKCLPDAYDNRIGTLLDLYRDICYSYINKKEVVPANLRKFDMGIYLFNSPIRNLSGSVQGWTSTIEARNTDNVYGGESQINQYRTSSKYIELHNCEIDYNSSKGGYGDFSLAEPKSPEYEIIIKYDDAFENRYNEFMMREIGDFVETDLIEQSGLTQDSREQVDDPTHLNNLKNRTNYLSYRSSLKNPLNDTETYRAWNGGKEKPLPFASPFYEGSKPRFEGYTAPTGKKSGVLSQLAGEAIDGLSSLVKNIYLGNFYSMSLSRVKDQVNDVLSGNIFNTLNAVQDYVEHGGVYTKNDESIEGKRLWEEPIQSQETISGKLWEEPIQSQETISDKNYTDDNIYRVQPHTLSRTNFYYETGQRTQAQALRNNI